MTSSWFKHPATEFGFHFGLGFIGAISVGAAVLLAGQVIANTLSLGTDDSDLSGWRRSGLVIHTDYKTGLQYLRAPDGGLTPRLTVDGRHMRIDVPAN